MTQIMIVHSFIRLHVIHFYLVSGFAKAFTAL